MRKLCNILSIFVFITIIFLSGCSENNYFFYFKNRYLSINITESINVYDLPVVTNIQSYEIVEVKADSDLVNVEGNIITPQTTGNSKIYVKIKFNENEITASFNLMVNDKNLNQGEDLTYIYEITEVEDNISVLELEIYKANLTYSNYSVSLNFLDENNLIFERKKFNYYEVKFYSNSQFTLQIKDLFNDKEYLISVN